jgi:transposase
MGLNAATCELVPAAPKASKTKTSANQPAEDLRTEFYRVLGVDLTAVPGLSVLTTQIFLSEIGPDLRRFETADRFCSWLGLCPGTKISGGRVLDARTRRGKPRFALSLRQAALSLHRNRGVLGSRYRRMRSRLGAPKALTAMAHLLARIIYSMLTTGKEYDESIFARLEQAHQERQYTRLLQIAKAFGYTLTPLHAS